MAVLSERIEEKHDRETDRVRRGRYSTTLLCHSLQLAVGIASSHYVRRLEL